MSLDADRDTLQTIAGALNEILNPGGDRSTKFMLVVFGFDAPGISNYVSNANREDMIKAMRETADRLERRQMNVRHSHPDDA